MPGFILHVDDKRVGQSVEVLEISYKVLLVSFTFLLCTLEKKKLQLSQKCSCFCTVLAISIITGLICNYRDLFHTSKALLASYDHLERVKVKSKHKRLCEI